MIKNLINYQSKKSFVGIFAIFALIAGVFAFTPSSASADCFISTTLRLGMVGAEVQCLQSSLAIPVTGVFDNTTRNAVINFQSSHGLVADGIFGPISRAAWVARASIVLQPGCTSTVGYSATTGLSCAGAANLPAGCTSTVGYSPLTGIKCDSSSILPPGCQPGYVFSVTTGRSCATNTKLPPGCTSLSGYSTTTGTKCDRVVDEDNDDDGELSGGEGSADYQLMSSLSDERVGEDEENVEVAGLRIEAEGSDIELTEVRLVFDESTATGDFEDYVDEVSVWLDGDLVGKADGDEFNKDNNWSDVISLDDAIIREGDTGELVVAISAVSNLAEVNEGKSWTVDFRQIRFEDAEGGRTSEDPNTGTRKFSFES